MSTRGGRLEQIQRRLRRGDTSLPAIVEGYLESIARHDNEIGAFLHVNSELVREQSHQLQLRLEAGDWPGELTGSVVAVKDNIALAKAPLTAGSRILAGYQPLETATALRRLIERGALVVGKTNLDEFGMGSSTEHSAYQLTRNPFATDRVPGGSSGGSAAAVAAGFCQAALGSDTGGSIRQPAAFCGLTGLKPTYGSVSRYGLVAYASSMDQIGPLASTADDCARLFKAMRGYDPRDATSRPASARDETGRRPQRAGVVAAYAAQCEPQVADAFEAFLGRCRRLGLELEEVELPPAEEAVAVYYVLATAEASSNLARYDGLHYPAAFPPAVTLAEHYEAGRSALFGTEVKRRILLGTQVLSAGYYERQYRRAQRMRRAWTAALEALFADVDILLLPTTSTAAFGLGERLADPVAMYGSDQFTIGANLTGYPALSVPVGDTDSGLPIGAQLWGPAGSDAMLLAFARLLDEDVPFAPLAGSRGALEGGRSSMCGRSSRS